VAALAYPPGASRHAAFKVPHLTAVGGDPHAPLAPPTTLHFVGSDSALSSIDQLLGALVDLPPSAWLFV